MARLFYEMAHLLEVRGESAFRVRAYQRAAQQIESLAEDLAAVAARGELQTIPGIGKDLATRITEYLATGKIGQLEALRAEVPPNFLTLLEVRGLGPKTAKLLLERLGVDSVDRLEEACTSGEILTVAGIREKTCENILKGIAIWRAGRSRMLLARARGIARQVVAVLQAQAPVERIEIAGSLRRMRETVKDIDLLVTSTDPPRVIETFVALPSVLEVIGAGDTKASVHHTDGIQIDLRVVDPAAFGAAMGYEQIALRQTHQQLRHGRNWQLGLFGEPHGRVHGRRGQGHAAHQHQAVIGQSAEPDHAPLPNPYQIVPD